MSSDEILNRDKILNHTIETTIGTFAANNHKNIHDAVVFATKYGEAAARALELYRIGVKRFAPKFRSTVEAVSAEMNRVDAQGSAAPAAEEAASEADKFVPTNMGGGKKSKRRKLKRRKSKRRKSKRRRTKRR